MKWKPFAKSKVVNARLVAEGCVELEASRALIKNSVNKNCTTLKRHQAIPMLTSSRKLSSASGYFNCFTCEPLHETYLPATNIFWASSESLLSVFHIASVSGDMSKDSKKATALMTTKLCCREQNEAQPAKYYLHEINVGPEINSRYFCRLTYVSSDYYVHAPKHKATLILRRYQNEKARNTQTV